MKRLVNTGALGVIPTKESLTSNYCKNFKILFPIFLQNKYLLTLYNKYLFKLIKSFN